MYRQSFAAYRALRAAPRPRAFQTECVVLWGPPGSGKTRAATAYDNPENTYWLPRPSGMAVWWDGYCGHRTVVVDEFYGWIRRDTVQRLIDRTPLRVEVKGGTVEFAARRVIFTSNKHPSTWWPRVGLGAMQRRLEDPIGAVVYVGNEQFPESESYNDSLSSNGYKPTSDDVPLGAGEGQY